MLFKAIIIIMYNLRLFACFLCFVGFIAPHSYVMASVKDTKPLLSEDEIKAKQEKYVSPDLELLSKLYWRLDKLDVENVKHINNYMRINECDVYQDYFHNEFEWNKILQTAKTYLLENKENFPLMFSIVQPLRLTEYDLVKGSFTVLEEYRVDGIRKMEVLANDSYEDVCGLKYGVAIPDYPKGLIVELSRPISLRQVPVDRNAAQDFIKERMSNFNKLRESQQTKRNLYALRDAYLVLNIKAFNYQKEEISNRKALANILGVLESLDVYADKQLTDLLFTENFSRSRVRPKEELLRKEFYQRRLKAWQAKKAEQQKLLEETFN